MIPKKEFMLEALIQAKKALDRGNLPIGSILVLENRIIDTSFNKNRENDSWINHAELDLIYRNSQRIKRESKSGKKFGIYCTLEPCQMCSGAIDLHRFDYIVFALEDKFGGGTVNKCKNILSSEKTSKIYKGLCREESLLLFKEYFRKNPKCELRMGEYFK